jgi:hypothetical protein
MERATNIYNSLVKRTLTIIFLDIDGVLLSYQKAEDGSILKRAKEISIERQYQAHPSNNPALSDLDHAAVDLFDEQALQNLDKLIQDIEKAGDTVGIVLSSNWRKKGDISFLKSLFGKHNFAKHIIDKTMDETTHDLEEFDHILGKRQLEINYWLDNTRLKNRIKNHIILDDIDFELSKKFGSKFIHCKNLFTANELNLAINELMLNFETIDLSDSPKKRVWK